MSSNAGDTQPDPAGRADAANRAGKAAVVGTEVISDSDEAEVATEVGASIAEQPNVAAYEAGESETCAADDVIGVSGSGEADGALGADGADNALEADGGNAEDDAATGLVGLDEPVELAEPVTVGEGGHRWQRVLIALSFVIAALAVVGGAIAIVGSLTHGFKKPVQITYKKSAIFSLKTGDCLDPQGTQAYTLVACDKPHTAEVFATFELPAGKWPGTAGARTAASSGCASRLTSYLNPQLAISLATTYVFPDSVAWQAGTRTVICEVQATSGQLAQSVRGASAG